MEIWRNWRRVCQRFHFTCWPRAVRKRWVVHNTSVIFALFFMFFILLVIGTQVLVMRDYLQSASRTNMHRFRGQVGVFGRVLAASRDVDRIDSANSSNVHHAASQHEKSYPIADGEGDKETKRAKRIDWLHSMWLCFKSGVCPWQSVAGASDKFFVYSAYLDDYNARDPMVRVIGVAKTRKPGKFWCLLGFPLNNGTRWQQVAAVVRSIREHWNLRYSAVFILCPLKKTDTPPKRVSISALDVTTMPLTPVPVATETESEFNETFGHWYDSATNNILPIRKGAISIDPGDRWSDAPQQVHKLSVCVKPFHYEFNRAQQLIEFIEMHRLLGVSYFTFYNHTVGPKVDCILRQYIEENLVQVLPWQRLDVVSQKEIRTEGIFASLNDCLYRHMYDSEYLLFIDFDEFIIPRKVFNLIDMILAIFTPDNNQTAAYYFRNAFFYLQWPNDPQASELPLITLQKTRRNSKLHPHRIRSKYICKPRQIVEVGNHFVWEFRSGHTAHHVPDSVAMVHHYRTCEFGGDTCLSNPSVEDKVAFKYEEPLVKAVRERIKQFNDKCHLVY